MLTRRTRQFVITSVFTLLLLSAAMAVDRSKFRTCDQTSFCRRNRGHTHAPFELKHVHFHLPNDEPNKKETTQEKHGSVWKNLQRKLLGENKKTSANTLGPPPVLTGTLTSASSKLDWTVVVLHNNMLRMRITEHNHPRVTYDDLVVSSDEWQAPAETVLWISTPHEQESLSKLLQQRGAPRDQFSNYQGLQYNTNYMLVIQLKPFQLSLYQDEELLTEWGHNLYFEMQQTAKRAETTKADDDASPDSTDETTTKEDKEIVGYWEDGLAIYADGTREEKHQADHRRLLDDEGLWEEKFESHTDSKPHGPMSVGMHVEFLSPYIYGLPEHASQSVLQTTSGSDNSHYKDPYRLYNLDVFEYELDEPMALYGSVPLIVSQSVDRTVGVFWFNPTETFVDVMDNGKKKTTAWMSESGIIDLFVLPGPDPQSVYKQYGELTGRTPLPPMFSLGYHQCRWNYKDEKDVDHVHSKFEELDYPYDVLWLDIEHTDGKRYFTWDKNLFPNPAAMQEKLWAQGRRMVTIIDPHIKRDDNYPIHKEATAKGLYIKDKDGKKDFDGWCWPGSSSYLDFTAEHVRNWWAERFGYDKYQGSTKSLFTWNDMNEPSVFNGPEVSMQKDLLNLNGEEHREWHNLYGMLFHRATSEGLIKRNENNDIRPFVLSRAFFAGSQKYGAIWTGDNTAEWGHLEIAAPMLLSLNVAALSFVGADVGGFFGNPEAELFTRWMQAGAYQPFFRGHAHHDSKRREPWMFDDDTLRRLRDASMTRYALLPYWYTVFYEAETNGMPVMRMMWMHYPKTEEVFGLDDQYLIGKDLLVKPVVSEGASNVEVIFPSDELWYDVLKQTPMYSSTKPNKTTSLTIPVDMESIPVYQRGGSIIPRKLRLRRSTVTMKRDPYTLFVALNGKKQAVGSLHMDDEESFGYQSGQCADATFTVDFSAGELGNNVEIGDGWKGLSGLAETHMIERIVVMGVNKSPKSLSFKGESLGFQYNTGTKVLVIRKPGVSAMENWTIKIN